MRRNLANIPVSIISHLIAASLGGWLFAAINMAVEAGRGQSIFAIQDFVKIALWHVISWGLVGAVIGMGLGLFYSFKQEQKKPNVFLLIYGYSLSVLWLFILGYLNIYYIANFFSFWPIILDIAIILSGTGSLIGMILFLRKRKIPLLIPKFIISLLTVATLYSAAVLIFQPSGISLRATKKKNYENPGYNVIFILLDAVRPDHLGCYGYKQDTTSHIDRLAEDGVLFERAFSQSSHTRESAPSYLTSTYPSTHNVKTVTSVFPKELVSLPELFKKAGYLTSTFSVNPNVAEAFGYKRGVRDFFSLEGDLLKIHRTIMGYLFEIARRSPHLGRIASVFLSFGRLCYSQEKALLSTDPYSLTSKAKKWISKNKNVPFFLYLHYDGGHNPYLSPYGKIFDPDFTEAPVVDFPTDMGMFYPFVLGKPIPPRHRQNLIAQYDGQIYFHDKQIGDLLSHLEDLELTEKTVIVITSDHGEEFYEHQCWGHGHSMFDESIHVPLIFYGHGLIPQGLKVNQQIALVDIFPTLLQLCRIDSSKEIPYQIEGKSLVPFFLDNESQGRDFIISEVNYGGFSARCIRTEKLKAIEIYSNGDTIRLFFNLENDPEEKNNIYDVDDTQCQMLFTKLQEVAKKSVEKAFKTPLDEKQKERLRSLGYIK